MVPAHIMTAWCFVLVRGAEYRCVNSLPDVESLRGTDGWRIVGKVEAPANGPAGYQVWPSVSPQPEIDRLLLIEAAKQFVERVKL